jgi:hypothetical protein
VSQNLRHHPPHFGAAVAIMELRRLEALRKFSGRLKVLAFIGREV